MVKHSYGAKRQVAPVPPGTALLSQAWTPAQWDAVPLPVLRQMLHVTQDILDTVCPGCSGCSCASPAPSRHRRALDPVELLDSTQENQVKLASLVLSAWKEAASLAVPAAQQAYLASAERGDSPSLQLSACSDELKKKLNVKDDFFDDDELVLGENFVKQTWTAYQEWAMDELWRRLRKEMDIEFSALLAREAQMHAFAEASSATLVRHTAFWTGTFYESHLSTRITAVLAEILGQTIGTRAKASLIQTSLLQELGVVAGGPTSLAGEIISRYAGNPALYFDGVTHNAIHQARMFSTMRTFSEGTRFQGKPLGYSIDNPNDRRTGPICRQLSGQHFSVDDGMSIVHRTLLTPPSEIRSVAPWHSASELESILEGTTPGSDEARARLVAAGAALPPFHLKCRSTVVLDS